MDGSDIRLAELDSLLNDPDVPMQAARVWDLLEELSAPSGEPDAAASSPR